MPIYDFLKVNEPYLYRMTWYTGTRSIMALGLLLCLALDPMVLYDGCTVYEWGHNYSFARCVGHSRLDSVSMRQYLGHQCCL